MQFIEKNIPHEFATQISNSFFYECVASNLCNKFDLYPDTNCKLIFNLSDGEILLNGAALPQIAFIGLTEQPLNFTFSSNVRLAGIRINCNFLRKELNVAALKNKFASLQQFSAIFRALKTSVESASTEDLFSVLNSALPVLAYHFTEVNSISIINSKKQQKGVRQIERIYKQEIGVSPKSYSSLSRFEKIKSELWETPDVPLTQLAYQFDFADQSHLIKELKNKIKITPKAYVRQIKCIKSQQKTA